MEFCLSSIYMPFIPNLYLDVLHGIDDKWNLANQQLFPSLHCQISVVPQAGFQRGVLQCDIWVIGRF